MKSPSDPRRKRRSFDCPEQEVYLNLWRTYDRLRVHEDELFARHELTAQQYNALRLLKAEQPHGLPTLELASRLISRAPDITRLVDRLEQRGLVRRERSTDDRRTVRVALTEAGVQLLRDLAGAVKECARRQLGHLSQEQQQLLIALLQAARQPHETEAGDW